MRERETIEDILNIPVDVPEKKSASAKSRFGSKSGPSWLDKMKHGSSALPGILGCTAVSYFLNLADCVHEIAKDAPGGLSFSYHLAAGAGLYGGATANENRRTFSLGILLGTAVPSLLQYTSDGDANMLATALGVKAGTYGVGYVIGQFF